MSTYLPAETPLHVPLPDGVDRPYHDGVARHELVLPRCGTCRTWQWPAEVLCWNCHRFGLDWERVDPQGTIFSWTRIWHPVRPYLADAVPYLVVLVEIAEAGRIRLLGNLLGDANTPICIGLPVTGTFEDAPVLGSAPRLQWRLAERPRDME